VEYCGECHTSHPNGTSSASTTAIKQLQMPTVNGVDESEKTTLSNHKNKNDFDFRLLIRKVLHKFFWQTMQQMLH
jgi:hypothetical protein